MADYHETFGGFRSGASVSIAPDASISEAADAIRASMTAAPQEVLIGWLAELSVRTIRREHDEFSDGLAVEVYSRELMRFPADAARKAIFAGWKYWPSLDAELIPAADRFSRARRAALRKVIDEVQSRRPADEKPRVSADRAREIIAEVMAAKRMPTE